MQHCKQTGAAENYLDECADDLQAQEITLGVTYRDRERLFPPVSNAQEYNTRTTGERPRAMKHNEFPEEKLYEIRDVDPTTGEVLSA